MRDTEPTFSTLRGHAVRRLDVVASEKRIVQFHSLPPNGVVIRKCEVCRACDAEGSDIAIGEKQRKCSDEDVLWYIAKIHTRLLNRFRELWRRFCHKG